MNQPARTYKMITDRLLIRCFEPKDALLLKRSIDESIEHLRPWMPWAWSEPQTPEEKINLLRSFRGRFDKGEDYTFGVFDLKETELLGATGWHLRIEGNACEIGYWVNVNHINKGIAAEIVCALTKTGFEIERFDKIEIHCYAKNTASAKVPPKCGYTLRETIPVKLNNAPGEVRDEMIWEMKRHHYFKSNLVDFPVQLYDILGREISFDRL